MFKIPEERIQEIYLYRNYEVEKRKQGRRVDCIYLSEILMRFLPIAVIKSRALKRPLFILIHDRNLINSWQILKYLIHHLVHQNTKI